MVQPASVSLSEMEGSNHRVAFVAPTRRDSRSEASYNASEHMSFRSGLEQQRPNLCAVFLDVPRCSIAGRSVNLAKKIAAAMEYDWHRDASWDPFATMNRLV